MKYRDDLRRVSAEFHANLSMRKGIEIVKSLGSFAMTETAASARNHSKHSSSSSAAAAAFDHERVSLQKLMKTLVFLVNQYFISEFIHQPFPFKLDQRQSKEGQPAKHLR